MKLKALMRPWALGALIGGCLNLAGQAPGYVETDLVVNQQVDQVPTLVDGNGIKHIAKFFDPRLLNPWGVAESPTSPFWISQAGAGVATLYNSAGAPQPPAFSIPTPSDSLGTGGIPTGMVFANLPFPGGFKVFGLDSNGKPTDGSAIFVFATKQGTILEWNPAVNPGGFDPVKAGKYAILAVNNSDQAAYTGLAIATDANHNTRLYAANFAAGTVDVFDPAFKPVTSIGAFTDPTLPRGYTPFNIVPLTINGTTRLFVTYAKPSDPFGQGQGFINSFDLDGGSRQRFAQRGQLNAPWGLVITPPRFGQLGGTLWVGNFGNGQINAYDPVTGEFIDKVRGADGRAIVIDRLWTLTFGNGAGGGDADTMYFTAGPNGETDGLFGSLNPQR